MTPISALSSASTAFTRGFDLAAVSGRQVLEGVTPDAVRAAGARDTGAGVTAAARATDVVSGVIGLVAAKAQTSAAAALARTATEMTGVLLDIVA